MYNILTLNKKYCIQLLLRIFPSHSYNKTFNDIRYYESSLYQYTVFIYTYIFNLCLYLNNIF